MPISVTCSCGKRFRVRDDLAGKKVKCPDCGESLSVPGMDDDEDELAALVPSSRKSSRKSKPQKMKSSALTATLIGIGVTALLVVGCCGGVGIWLQRSLNDISEKRKIEDARFLAERRARGEPVSLDDYPPLAFNSEVTATFTQEVSLPKRKIRIPADFHPLILPEQMKFPRHVSHQSFERPYVGPLSKLAITFMTDTLKLADAQSFLSGHQLNVAEYILTTKFFGAKQSPAVYGRVGDLLLARTVLETESPDKKPMKVLYTTIGDGTQTHNIVVLGLATDDAATLQQFEAIIATLQ